MSKKVFKTSKNGVDLIKKWEGFRSEAYYDSVGVLTIGYGHTNNAPSGDKYPVYEGKVVTEEQATIQLQEDLVEFENSLNSMLDTSVITQNIFDSLMSFIYNLGATTVGKSAVVSYTNEQKWDLAMNEIKKYNKAGGVVNQGLVNRRNDEVKLYGTDLPETEKWIEYAEVVEEYNVFVGGDTVIKVTSNSVGGYADEELTKKLCDFPKNTYLMAKFYKEINNKKVYFLYNGVGERIYFRISIYK